MDHIRFVFCEREVKWKRSITLVCLRISSKSKPLYDYEIYFIQPILWKIWEYVV